MTQSDTADGLLIIDPHWLTNEFERAGVARGASVDTADFVTLVGTGQMGRSARFALSWSDPAGRPATIVAKFPTDDPTARTTGFENGSYAKEYLFYSELHETVDVRAPAIWAARYEADVPDFVFVMEDLDGSVQGDQFRGLDVDEAALAVEQAVALHAPRWGDDALDRLFTDPTVDRAELLAGYYMAMIDPALERLAPHLDEGCVGVARDLAPLISTWIAGTETPATLVHMDFRPDNFLFAATPDAPPLVIVDWQTINYGLAMNDVAYMIGGSFEPDARSEVEHDLVEEYRSRIVAAGVPYQRDACWHDYRVGSVWGVVMSIIATILAEQTERGDRMLGTMLRRHAHHAIDLDAIALLDGAT